MLTKFHSSSLILEVPRKKLERMISPVSVYGGLTIGSEQVTTSIFMKYVNGLPQIQDQLNPHLADHLSSVAIDLPIAGLSERISRETPKRLTITLMIQQAKAYSEANLDDPTLNFPQLAIAMGARSGGYNKYSMGTALTSSTGSGSGGLKWWRTDCRRRQISIFRWEHWPTRAASSAIRNSPSGSKITMVSRLANTGQIWLKQYYCFVLISLITSVNFLIIRLGK
jgi:hypothetical protein